MGNREFKDLTSKLAYASTALGVVALAAWGISKYEPAPPEPEPQLGGYVQGIVQEELGTLHHLQNSVEGAIALKDSEKNLTYGIRVRTEQGEYLIDLSDDYLNTTGPHTPENLEMVIKVGTQIKFPTTYGGKTLVEKRSTWWGFKDDKVGNLDPDEIIILRQ